MLVVAIFSSGGKKKIPLFVWTAESVHVCISGALVVDMYLKRAVDGWFRDLLC